MTDRRIEIDTEYAKAQAAIKFRAGLMRRAFVRRKDRDRLADAVKWEAARDEVCAIERDLWHYEVQLAGTPREETVQFLVAMRARQNARRDQLLATIDELDKRLHP